MPNGTWKWEDNKHIDSSKRIDLHNSKKKYHTSHADVMFFSILYDGSTRWWTTDGNTSHLTFSFKWWSIKQKGIYPLKMTLYFHSSWIVMQKKSEPTMFSKIQGYLSFSKIVCLITLLLWRILMCSSYSSSKSTLIKLNYINES